MNTPDAASKTTAARDALRARFTSIRVALDDLTPSAFGVRAHEEFQDNRLFVEKYQNRLVSAFLLLSHLRDDARRFAKRCGIDISLINAFVNRSLAVRICIRAGDTRKHGLVGRSKNATISNGLICVVKSPPGEEPNLKSDAIVIGMVLVDAVHEVFHSHVVMDQAIRDWVDFLASELILDLRAEIEPWLARRSPMTMVSLEDQNATVPPGSVVGCEFPSEFAEALIQDVKKRVERT